jgi:hypothetical protein
MGSTNTTPMIVEMAPAVCRIIVPIASASSPSTVRYSPAPATARVTPEPLNDTGTWAWRMAEPTKNEQKATISAWWWTCPRR